MERSKGYLLDLLPEKPGWMIELEKQANAENIPIMDPLGMEFVLQQIRIAKPAAILEIGTAIGYSALCMLEANSGTNIFTIEKDEKRYQQAVLNIKSQNKQHKIQVIYGDALESPNDEVLKQEFDMLFIDAAKGKYKAFFDMYSPLVRTGGLIVSDNVLFRGYVANPEDMHPRYEKLVRSIRDYNDWLLSRNDYMTIIVPIGDGVSISIKK